MRNEDEHGYHEVKKPPLGVRLDKPVYRASTPGMPAYTSHAFGRESGGGSGAQEWSLLRGAKCSRAKCEREALFLVTMGVGRCAEQWVQGLMLGCAQASTALVRFDEPRVH